MIELLPEPGEILFIWTGASFSSFAVLPRIIMQEGNIAELIISSFTLNLRIFDSIMNLFNRGQIGRIYLFLNDSIEKRLPTIYQQLLLYSANNPAIKVQLGWNHSKVTLVKTSTANYCLEGSGNFSETARHEQYTFSNDRDIYEFRRRTIIAQFK